jgi:Peptidase family M48
VQKLSRDELQGVMGHEFSHILNGDMALNVRLVGFLAGLTWFADAAERLIFEAARHNRGARPRGARRRGAGLRAHTAVRAAHCELFSHMFFAPAVGRWWGFPSHPPILERIRRAHPRFRRDHYRERRHGTRTEVAVIDGSGNVVKNLRLDSAAAVAASVGRPAPEHVDYAARLLARLPSRLREALHRAEEAESAMFALALGQDEATREAELRALGARRGPDARAKAADLYVYVGGLARDHMLTLADLARPWSRPTGA